MSTTTVPETPGRKTKWDVKREASYQALIESAVRVFHTRGYAATTVADIVAGTGYTAGAFYHHFSGKAECFWHVIEHRERQRGDWTSIAAQVDRATNSLEQLLVQVFARFAASMGGYAEWVLVMVDFFQQHRDDAESLARLARIYGHWRDDIRRFVESLVANGWIEPVSDPALLAQQMFAFGEGIIVHRELYGRAEGAAALDRALIDGLVKLLR